MTISNDKVQLSSVYVPMPDGVQLAVDVWRQTDEKIAAMDRNDAQTLLNMATEAPLRRLAARW